MKLKSKTEEGSLSGDISRRIEDSILSGKFRPNQQLPVEAELCKLFNVSRTVVREAINTLKARGFLKSITGSGTYVLPYDFSHVNTAIERFSKLNSENDVLFSLFELRLLIELESAERLVKTKDPAVFVILQATLDGMKEIISYRKHDANAFIAFDAKFHQTLVESSGNPVFSLLLSTLRGTINHPFDQTAFPLPLNDIMKTTYDHHSNILKNIEAGSSEKARAAVRTHLQHAIDLFKLSKDTNKSISPVARAR